MQHARAEQKKIEENGKIKNGVAGVEETATFHSASSPAKQSASMGFNPSSNNPHPSHTHTHTQRHSLESESEREGNTDEGWQGVVAVA